MRHIKCFKLLEEEVEAGPLPFQLVALPLDQSHLCYGELEKNVKEYPREVGVR